MALNKPFTDTHSRGTKQPCWRASDALGWDKQSKVPFYMGRFPFNQNFRKFGNSGNGTEISGKVSEILETVEFPKCEPFNQKFWKFWKQSWMERKLPGKRFRKFGYTSRGFPLFWKVWKMLFHSLLEVVKNSNRTFWLSGKRPRSTCTQGCFLPWLTAKDLLTRTNGI